MAETKKNWCVLRAVSRKEAKLKEYIEVEIEHNALLQQYVSQVLVPMEKLATLRNGKGVKKEKISLPEYTFVETSLVGDVTHTLRFIPNYLGLLGDLSSPSSVPQSEINRMLGEAGDTEIMNGTEVPYEVDEVVKITGGPFSGFSDVIEEVNAEKHKLKVLVKIFGRKTPLELSFMQIEEEAQRSYGHQVTFRTY